MIAIANLLNTPPLCLIFRINHHHQFKEIDNGNRLCKAWSKVGCGDCRPAVRGLGKSTEECCDRATQANYYDPNQENYNQEGFLEEDPHRVMYVFWNKLALDAFFCFLYRLHTATVIFSF